MGAGGGLVGVQHPHRAQQFPHAGQEGLVEQAGGAAPDRGEEPDRDVYPGQGRQHRGRSADRQVVRAGQLRGRGEHPGPVHSARRHPLRGGPGPRRSTARAGTGDDPVLGHIRRRGRGDVGDLTALHPADRGPGQVAPTVPAAVDVAVEGLVGVVDQRHRRPTRAGLLAGLSPGGRARGGPLRLAIRRVRRGRLRRCRRVRAQPPLQLLDPPHLRGQLRRQRRDLPGQRLDLHCLRVDHLTQPCVGLPQSSDDVRVNRRRLDPGHPAMITEPARRSNRHAHDRLDQAEPAQARGC